MSISLAEAAGVVKKLPSGKMPGVDEVCHEMLKALNIVGLSWLTRLFIVVWRSGTVPLEWQTGMEVPILKKGDQDITLLSPPGKVYSRVFFAEPQIWEEQLRIPF